MDASWPLLPLQNKKIDHSVADKVRIFVFAAFVFSQVSLLCSFCTQKLGFQDFGISSGLQLVFNETK